MARVRRNSPKNQRRPKVPPTTDPTQATIPLDDANRAVLERMKG